MRQLIVTFLATISSLILFGQSADTWTSFWNKDRTRVGFKDKNGVVKIAPKFTEFVTARKFENIIGVSENRNGKWDGYYLTKQGRIVGSDSLYIFDNSPDCENEGFIRFRDRKTDKAGIFNKKGDIVIPAIYNDLTKVRNGMIIALKGAEKKYLEGDEYYSWVGGQEVLIDTKNTILIENFKLDNDVNFFTLEKQIQFILTQYENHF